jgi:hypothetical protein
MNTSTHTPASTPSPRSLWLHVSWEAGPRVFEFPPGESRAVVVGSYLQSDVRVVRQGFPPIAFCFERQGDFILVAPMASGDLRLNASRVVESWPLVGGAVLEFAGARIDVTVLNQPPSEELLGGGETRLDYLTRLPDEKDPTELATAAVTFTQDAEATHATVQMAPFDMDSEAMATEVMPRFHFWDEAPLSPDPEIDGESQDGASLDAVTASTTLRLRSFSHLLAATSSAPQVGVVETERVKLVPLTPEIADLRGQTSALPRPFLASPETTTFLTEEFDRGAATRQIPSPRRPQRGARSAMPVGDSSVSTEDTTAFELGSLEVPKSSVAAIVRRREDEPPQAGTSTPPSKRLVGSTVTTWLARLGVTATEQPLRVAAIGLGGALIMVLLLIGLHRVTGSKRATPTSAPTVAAVASTPSAVQTTRAPEVRAPASEPTISPAPLPVAAPRQVSVPVIGAAASAQPRSGLPPAARADSEAVAALKCLVDGRDADALRAYSALAARSPENPAYQVLVRLLRRRADQSCSGSPPPSVSCPEVKR